MVQKGYLPKGIDHAAKSTTSFTDPRPVITSEEEAVASAEATDLYLPEDMGKILAAAEMDERVTLELKAFSGLRTEELARMWLGADQRESRLHQRDRRRREGESASGPDS
jgi:predicted RNA polymerase sigma factor